jgi:putative PIN family toxin of toxin-antitoxin system
MLRLVLDTDVIVAGLRSPTGASAALLRAGRNKQACLLASAAMVLEYEAVCTLANHRTAAHISLEDVQDFLNTLAAILEPVEPYFSWRPQLSDANDEMVLETAINGRAHGIVTFNVRHFGTAPQLFGIGLWKPSEAIGRVRHEGG